jgi:hypothetical protein
MAPHSWEEEALASVVTLVQNGTGPALIIIVQAGAGAFARKACCALSPCSVPRGEASQPSKIVLLDSRYFVGGGVDKNILAEMEAFEEERGTAPGGPLLLVKRLPGSLKERKAMLHSLLTNDSYESVAMFSPESTEATLALELVHIFVEDVANSTCCKVGCISLAGCDPPSPPKLRAHAEDNFVYLCGLPGAFSARGVRNAPLQWKTKVQRALCACQPDPFECGVRARFPCSCPRYDLVDFPVIASRCDQLRHIRSLVFQLLSTIPIDGNGAHLRASCPQRYVEGGYSAFHYVTVAPNDHEASFELFDGNRAIGFISIAAQHYAIEAHVGTWPFKSDGQPLDVGSISRAVLLPEARGKSLFPKLLKACSLYHLLGIPVRITTRKREVAEHALSKVPCLVMDRKSFRMKETERKSDVMQAYAIVPYNAELASNAQYFQTRAPPASMKSRRRRNEGFHFWYCASPVVAKVGGILYKYDSVTGKFEVVAKDCEEGPLSSRQLRPVINT